MINMMSCIVIYFFALYLIYLLINIKGESLQISDGGEVLKKIIAMKGPLSFIRRIIANKPFSRIEKALNTLNINILRYYIADA